MSAPGGGGVGARGRSSRTRSNVKTARQDSTHSRTLAIPDLPACSEEDLVALSSRCQNPCVQESDGNFFESFTALSWKQENRRLRAAREDESEADRPPPPEQQVGHKSKYHQLSRKEFELLYIEVLYTIKHKIGTTTGGHLPYIQDLSQYAQEAFGMLPEDHARLLARATEEKPPIVILNVGVVEATDLEAKDADGYSDPYCMLGIMPGRSPPEKPEEFLTNLSSEEDSPGKSRDKDRAKGLRKFSKSFKKRSIKQDKTTAVRDLLPAKLIRTTCFVPNNLNPVWKEKFRFDLDDVMTDRLHLDIWDHDEEFSVFDAAKTLNEVSSLRGLGRFFKQIAQSARTDDSTTGSVDDFLGCVNIPLHDIPSTGIDRFYVLEGRSSRSTVQGEIRLKLSLATREDRGIPEDDNWTDVRQHEDLMCIFIDHERRQYQDPQYTWQGTLAQAALTILHQHTIQGDITDIQQAICRWIAFSRKHIEHALDYGCLLDLLKTMDSKWEEGSLSRDEEECLAESFTLFIQYCLNLLRRHRDIFPPANKIAFHRLQILLGCVSQIYDLKLYRKCCPFQKELNTEVSHAIKRGTAEWYDRVYSTSKAQPKAEDDFAQALIELTNSLNNDLYKAMDSYEKVFDSLGVNYFHVVYRQVEKMLFEDVGKALQEEVGPELTRDLERMSIDTDDVEYIGSSTLQANTTLFELYLALQEFCKFRQHIPHSDWKSLSVPQNFDWFRTSVQKWLIVAKHKAMRRIRKAVELDKVADSNGGIRCSTSAADVCSCFNQITEFWKQLAWPDLIGAFVYISRLTQDLCQGAVLYVDLMHDKLKAAGYYDEDGQFDVTEQLCVTINNIEMVRRALKPLPEMLRFSDLQTAMEKHGGDKGARKARAALTLVVKQSDDEMVKKIKHVVDRVSDKMRHDIKKDVFHLNWSPESVPAEEAIVHLMEYLDNNLITLNANLLKTNFDRILASIWAQVLAEFNDVVVNESKKGPAFYQRMFNAVLLLVDFFHANNKGLPMHTIETSQYQDLKSILNLHRLDTKDLIEVFYAEKMKQQTETVKTDFGSLQVRVWYKNDSHTLLIEVVSAKELIPLDTNGLSDPFVMIQLCPEHKFTTLPQVQTKVIKKTLNPTFDESFEFAIDLGMCKEPYAVIVFTVMDHDIMFQNDFAGEAYVLLRDVPGIQGGDVSGYDALHAISLPLMQSKYKGRGAFQVLSDRKFEKEAQDFVRKRSRFEEPQI